MESTGSVLSIRKEYQNIMVNGEKKSINERNETNEKKKRAPKKRDGKSCLNNEIERRLMC